MVTAQMTLKCLMEKQNVVHPYSEILFAIKRKKVRIHHMCMNDTWKHYVKEATTKVHILYNSIYRWTLNDTGWLELHRFTWNFFNKYSYDFLNSLDMTYNMFALRPLAERVIRACPVVRELGNVGRRTSESRWAPNPTFLVIKNSFSPFIP